MNGLPAGLQRKVSECFLHLVLLSRALPGAIWYTEVKQGAKRPDEALRFAEQNWASFLPSAHEGWGKLLMRLSKPRRTERGKVSRHMRGVEEMVKSM